MDSQVLVVYWSEIVSRKLCQREPQLKLAVIYLTSLIYKSLKDCRFGFFGLVTEI